MRAGMDGRASKVAMHALWQLLGATLWDKIRVSSPGNENRAGSV